MKGIRLAAGCALSADHPELPVEKLVIEADYAMYKAKEAFYRKNGKRGRRR